MSDYMTCYERDEVSCEDPTCLQGGCRLRSHAPTRPEPDVHAALRWAMDEIDILANKLCGWAYPQAMTMGADRKSEQDNYVRAVEARRCAAMIEQPDQVRQALKASMVAIDDWLNTYASDMCDPDRVEQARKRLAEHGTLWYIAKVQEANRAALAAVTQPTATNTDAAGWSYRQSIPEDGFECYFLDHNGVEVGSINGPQSVERTALVTSLVGNATPPSPGAVREALADAFAALTAAEIADKGLLPEERDMIVAALSRPAHGGWQDISTAPRDGTQVLLWSEAWEMSWGIQIGAYVMPDCKWETSEGMVQDNDLGFDPDAEFDEHDFDEDANLGPTHWQPLPAGPHTRNEGKSHD